MIMEHLDFFQRRAEAAMSNLGQTAVLANVASLSGTLSTLRQLLERGDDDGHT
jgi:hypothetical protein